MKKFCKTITVASLLGLMLVTANCSKDESSSGDNKIISFFKSTFSNEESLLERNPLAKKISADSPLFVIWDSTNSEYQNMVKKSPRSFSSNSIESLIKNDAFIRNYFEILKRVFNTDSLDASSFASKGVFFFEELKEDSFPLATYATLKNELNVDEVYKAIKDFANENAYDYKEDTIEGERVANVTFRNKDAKEFNMKFLVRDKGLAVSNRSELIKRYLTSDFDSKYIENLINKDEDFKKSYSKSLKEDTTSFGFGALILNSKFLPDQKVQEELSKLPVKNLVINQAFNNKDMLVTRVASFYSPKDEGQKKIAKAFNSSNTVVAPSTLPNDTMFSITVSMNLLKSLIDEFGFDKEVAPYAHLLDMKNINITLQSPNGTMFPNVAIVAENVEDSNKIINDLKSAVASSKGALPIPTNAWQKKKVNNIDTEYLTTPFGIGLFIAKTNDDELVLASSENLLSEITGKASKQNAELIRKKYDARNNGILNAFGSSKSVAKTLKVLNATLATFAKTDISTYEESIKILEQTPDSVIDIFSEDNTIIGESKIALE